MQKKNRRIVITAAFFLFLFAVAAAFNLFLDKNSGFFGEIIVSCGNVGNISVDVSDVNKILTDKSFYDNFDGKYRTFVCGTANSAEIIKEGDFIKIKVNCGESFDCEAFSRYAEVLVNELNKKLNELNSIYREKLAKIVNMASLIEKDISSGEDEREKLYEQWLNYKEKEEKLQVELLDSVKCRLISFSSGKISRNIFDKIKVYVIVYSFGIVAFIMWLIFAGLADEKKQVEK